MNVNNLNTNIMNTGIKKSILFLLAIFFIAAQAISQPAYQVNHSKSKLIISGTSSLHDWTMEADDFSCDVLFDMNNNEVNSINDIRFSLPVENIKSESNLMDKKAYEALKQNKAPMITFRQQSLESLNSSDGQISGKISGSLTVAGRTKQVSLAFEGKVLANNNLSVTGKLPVKMSDFGIDPPTALLGTLKTDDAVTLEYQLEFIPNLTSNR